jgi:hypothetical protein
MIQFTLLVGCSFGREQNSGFWVELSLQPGWEGQEAGSGGEWALLLRERCAQPRPPAVWWR